MHIVQHRNGEKMNILLINHYAGSPDMGMEFRPFYMAREWRKEGHQVFIIAGDYSHLRKNNPEVRRDFEKETIDGIHYIWIKTGAYEGNGVKRALSMARFVSKLWVKAERIAKKLKPDIVIASSTYPIDTYAAQKIAKKAHASLIHEVHDMWPSTLTEIGGMPKYHPFVAAMQIGENSAYRNSDYVVSLAPYAEKYMLQHGLKKGRFVYITNGIVAEDWEHPKELPQFHAEILESFRQEDKFIVGYFGGHALSNALDVLIDLAKSFQNNKQVVFVLVGNGVEKKKLQKRVQKEEIDNVCFLPPISKYSIPSLTHYFDCIYIGAKDSPLYRFGVAANKIFDSMMSGKPLLYAVNSPNNFAEKYHCGISVPPDDTKAIKSGLDRLIMLTEKEREKMGENGKKAVLEHFQYSVLAKKFLDVMEHSKELPINNPTASNKVSTPLRTRE